MNTPIKLTREDITTLKVDAIVNATDKKLSGKNGIDAAVHKAAGPALAETCKTIGGLKVGKAIITAGFKLPSAYIIHTVGPVWGGGYDREDEILASSYMECIKLAVKHGIKTIAFPAISCGAYGFPAKRAAKIAVDSLNAYAGKAFNRIIIVCPNDEVYHAYKEILAKP